MLIQYEQQLSQYEHKLGQWLEHIVQTGNDDALFASGYLQGHFTLMLSEFNDDASPSVADIVSQMQASLALAAKELSAEDYQLVIEAWQSLQQALAA